MPQLLALVRIFTCKMGATVAFGCAVAGMFSPICIICALAIVSCVDVAPAIGLCKLYEMRWTKEHLWGPDDELE